MSYSPNHTEGECDKCLKDVGKKNLKQVRFLYCDHNDKVHPDEIGWDGSIRKEAHYKQYYVCEDCFKVEREMENNRAEGK